MTNFKRQSKLPRNHALLKITAKFHLDLIDPTHLVYQIQPRIP